MLFIPMEMIVAVIGSSCGAQSLESLVIHALDFSTGCEEFDSAARFRLVIQEEIDARLGQSHAHPEVIQYVNEDLIALSMNGGKIDMREVALFPSLRAECPFVSIVVCPMSPALELRFLTVLDEVAAALDTVSEWLNGRQLTEIACDHKLDAAESTIVSSGFFHHCIKSLEVQILNHADLIEDKDIRVLKPLLHKLSMSGLHQLFQGLLMAIWCPAGISPSSGTVDV